MAGIFLAGLAMGSGTFGAKAAPVRKHINLPGRAVAAPFSDAVLVGDTLYLAGRIGFLPGTRQVPAATEEEAKRCSTSSRPCSPRPA
jgi:enamine deaminase RidA (YjgF/YER057c/UK114 family)